MKYRIAMLVIFLVVCRLASAATPDLEQPQGYIGSNYAIVAPTFNSATASSSLTCACSTAASAAQRSI